MSPGDPEQIREDIEATREELGDTVERLAAKTDVAGLAKRRLSEAPAMATGVAQRATMSARRKPAVMIMGAAGLGFVILRLRRRR